MKSAKSGRRFPLTVESLEDRCVPAGNVTAVFSNGFLHITGDSQGNDIQIVGVGGGINLQVSSGPDATTINNGPAITFPGVYRLSLDLGNGNDRVELADYFIYDQQSIQAGNGNDVIIMKDLFLPSLGQFSSQNPINTGNGKDVIDISRVYAGSLNIHSGDDNDVILLKDLEIGGLYGSELEIDSGNGNDQVFLDSVEVDRFILNTGNGNDYVYMTGKVFNGELQFDLGNGDDVLEIDPGAEIIVPFGTIDGGNGFDRIQGTSGLIYFPLDNIFFEEIDP